MERCPNCGNKLSSIDVLCPKCGAVVEVIQTKGNIPSASEAVTQSSTKKPETAQKKDIPKYFNVYYEDLPDEDSEDSENNQSGAAPAELPAVESEPSFQVDLNEQPNSARPAEQPPVEQPSPEKYNKNSEGLNKIVTAKVSENDNDDYSSRYLENLKNLNLPEIEDISNFDPEEYMREYKYKKILANQSAANDNSSPAKKQWLEIEETENNLESELAKAREDVQNRTEEPEIVQRRYKGTQESRTERRRDFKPEKKRDYNNEIKRDYGGEVKRDYNNEATRDYSTEINVETAGEENIELPAKDKKSKKKAAGMVLFWIVITVAIFFCSIFFDNFVKYSYGSYDNFFYSITNGQVDLDSGNS